MGRNTPKQQWSRRCLVDGCPEHGRWVTSNEPPLPTEHPDSHYSRCHAAPEDVAPRVIPGGTPLVARIGKAS